MGFFGVGQRGIGSRHLHDDAVIDRTITDDAVGSQCLTVSAVAYETQIKGNILGFGRLTAGLQGSFGIGAIGIGSIAMDKLKEHFERGRVGSFIYYNASYKTLGTPLAAENNVTAMVLTEKANRMWCTRFTSAYIDEVNTVTGAVVNTIAVPNSGIYAVDFAEDKNRFWGIKKNSPVYLYEFGTTTGAVVGSLNVTSSVGTNIQGLAIDDDYDLYILNFVRHYIYKMGTVGNLIGSIRNTACDAGLGWDTTHKHLWSVNSGNQYVLRIGTTTGNMIGSFIFTPNSSILDAKWDTNNGDLWVFSDNSDRFYRVPGFDAGTYVHFASPFSAKPTVVATQIQDTRNLGIRIQEPTLGSFRIDAAPGSVAKAMWMAWGSR